MKTKQTILITGATTGIGRHAALHLARKGHRVIATGRNREALAKLAADANGLALDVLRLDVTSAASIAEALTEVARLTAGMGIDVLVNNAGYGQAGPVEEITDADMRAQFETNVFGLMAVTRAFLPQLRSRGAGRIVNVSSVGGRVTFQLFGVYNASKYAVEALSDAMRVELAPFGVRVVLIEPGPIKTEFADRTMTEIARYRNDASPYAAAYAHAEELRAFSDKQAAGPETVSRAIEKAITARRPAARYVAPWRNNLLLWFLAALPTRWSDALLARLTGMTRKRLNAKASYATLPA